MQTQFKIELDKDWNEPYNNLVVYFLEANIVTHKIRIKELEEENKKLKDLLLKNLLK